MNIKICNACGTTKPFTEFFADKRALDKHTGKCKACMKLIRDANPEKAVEYREVHAERARARARAWHANNRARAKESAAASYKANREVRLAQNKEYRNNLPAGEAARRSTEYSIKYRELNPFKYAAQTKVGNALRDGKLTKTPCEVCGCIEHVHAHHDDYAKPLEVRWLCAFHHKEWHNLNGEGLVPSNTKEEIYSANKK